MTKLERWYEDRDFPEIKSSNADIVAVVIDKKDRTRIIEEHNTLVEDLTEALIYLREGKIRFTDSDVDSLLAKWSGE